MPGAAGARNAARPAACGAPLLSVGMMPDDFEARVRDIIAMRLARAGRDVLSDELDGAAAETALLFAQSARFSDELTPADSPGGFQSIVKLVAIS
jgi:hypothetical protein